MRFFITICFLAMTCFANAQSAAMQKEIDRAIALADFSSAMEQTMALQFESRGLTEHLTDPKAMYKELTEAMSEPLKKILTKVYSDNFTLDELNEQGWQAVVGTDENGQSILAPITDLQQVVAEEEAETEAE